MGRAAISLLAFVVTLFQAASASAQASFPGAPNPHSVTTFNSISLYWHGVGSASVPAQVEFKEAGASTWRRGLDLWYDARNSEYRGSIVELRPGTTYDVKLTLVGPGTTSTFQASTWSENFPVPAGWTITVPPGIAQVWLNYPRADVTAPFTWTRPNTGGGTQLVVEMPLAASANQYVLITSAPGTVIDQTGVTDMDPAGGGSCVKIAHGVHHAIIRGLTLQNCQRFGVFITRHISVEEKTRDVVIEDNQISGWGNFGHNTSFPNTPDLDGAIHCQYDFTPADKDHTRPDRIIIQRNEIFNPRHGATHWAGTSSSKGPDGVYFGRCGSNHVIRHNAIYSTNGNYLRDGLGGLQNSAPAAEGMFGMNTRGFPWADSDIYGNRISQTNDEAIEAEGANRNVRIWGNYFDDVFTAIGNSAVSVGPLYVWRNVANSLAGRRGPTVDPDDEDRGPFVKGGTGSSDYNGGRAYYFHNTGLQPDVGQTHAGGAGYGINSGGGLLYNFVSKNNIWQIHRTDGFLNSASIEAEGLTGAQQATVDANYDLYNGALRGLPAGAEAQGISGTPVYMNLTLPALENGWSGDFSLAPGTPGKGAALPIPNFNDQYPQPDMGAHQSASPAPHYGVGAASVSARLDANPLSGAAPLNVQFSAVNSKPSSGVTYHIDFGDGTAPSTSATPPAHAYAAAGTYTATLTVTHSGTGQTSTDWRTIQVGGASAFELALGADPGLTVDRAAAEQVQFQSYAADYRALQHIRFYIDGVLKHTDTTSPWQYSWPTAAENLGAHTLRVEATDMAGTVVSETRSLFLISGACNVIPAAASVAHGEPLQVQAVCSTSKSVKRIRFLVDGVMQDADATSSYTWTMDTAAFPAGNRSIGITGVLATPTGEVEVNHSTTVAVTAAPLSVAFSAGPVIARGEQTTVTVSAPGGETLKQVDFYVDGALRHSENVAPFEYVWRGLPPERFGRHTLVVQATDSTGNVLTAKRDLHLLTQACNLLVGTSKYRVANHDTVSTGVHTIKENEPVVLDAVCSPLANLQRVEFWLDNTLRGSETVLPYVWTLDTSGVPARPQQPYDLRIKAIRDGAVVSEHATTLEIVAP